MNIKNTKGVILHTRHYIFGETLDLGAGTAKYQFLIRPYASKYTTLDMAEGKNIDVVGDVLKPPFGDNSFDTVISTQVLEHVEKPWIMVQEIARILRSKGVCIITAPFLVPYHADPHDFFRYTEEGLASLFRNEGFDVIENGSYGKIFFVFSEMIHFSLLNPYGLASKSLWARRIVRKLESIAVFLDSLVSNKIIYSNVYAVVRKK